jgi:hypothetical protein
MCARRRDETLDFFYVSGEYMLNAHSSSAGSIGAWHMGSGATPLAYSVKGEGGARYLSRILHGAQAEARLQI